MGKSQLQMGYKSQFEHFLEWFDSLRFDSAANDCNSICYFFAMRFGPRDLTAKHCWLLLIVFSCLACWVNWFSLVLLLQLVLVWEWQSHTLKTRYQVHWQWPWQIASSLLCCTDHSSCLCTCEKKLGFGIWLEFGAYIWNLHLGHGIWDMKIKDLRFLCKTGIWDLPITEV